MYSDGPRNEPPTIVGADLRVGLLYLARKRRSAVATA